MPETETATEPATHIDLCKFLPWINFSIIHLLQDGSISRWKFNLDESTQTSIYSRKTFAFQEIYFACSSTFFSSLNLNISANIHFFHIVVIVSVSRSGNLKPNSIFFTFGTWDSRRLFDGNLDIFLATEENILWLMFFGYFYISKINKMRKSIVWLCKKGRLPLRQIPILCKEKIHIFLN